MTTDTSLTMSSGQPDFRGLAADLEAWYARVIVRMFYPNTAASVPIAMPDSLMSLHKNAASVSVLSDHLREAVPKAIVTLRDGSAALVAQGVSGTVPDYRGFVQLQKYYTELLAVLREAAETHRPAHMPPMPGRVPATPTLPDAKKPTPSTPDAVSAFTTAQNVFQDDTPLKRYVRSLKSSRSTSRG